MSLPKYGEYKKSGIPWLGNVPSHWEVRRFKWLIDRNDGGVWGDEPDGVDDTVVLRSTEQTVDGCWRIDDPAMRKLSERDRLSALLAEGDLLLTKSSGSALHIGKTTLVDRGVAELNACYSNFMQRIRVRHVLSPKIAWYILNNGLARAQLDLLSNSTTGLANLNGAIIGEVVVPTAPAEEQAAIANFLDHETAKIDTLIAEQEKLLALLAEKRQATIYLAVTRGLNPNAPMKDSGIPWFGEVPQHWEMRRLKSISPSITVGIVVNPSDYISEFGLPFIYGGDISEGVISTTSCRRIPPEDSARQPKTRLSAGDLLTVRVGAPGVTAVVPPECEGGNCASVVLIRRGDFDSRWLCFAMNSRMVRYQVEVVQYGAAQEQFNIAHAAEFWIATPPKDEQLALAQYIEENLAKLGDLRKQTEGGIGLLKERRSALIAAAVTGKIDVRGLVEQVAA
ncbi:restriction endonuclease subunit S [Cognatiluteimonas telluris]|jgi:type I restriction enzyme S subunit|uniref:restriction endonuclease subunit S n=1 Tax=Cognatiluteimonas telluris TaxID=1104775 RepID=UPI00140BC362|nr:restriction endonuclease subunit S [Lysobacter telluris]